MLERHVFFDRDALLLLVFPSFLFFLLSMKGIKHLIITSAEYHGPWYLPSKHILKITPWSDMDPFILVLAALSVTDKYLFLLRIVPEMHTPGICKPHSATPPTPPNPHPHPTPHPPHTHTPLGLRHPCHAQSLLLRALPGGPATVRTAFWNQLQTQSYRLWWLEHFILFFIFGFSFELGFPVAVLQCLRNFLQRGLWAFIF